MEAILVTLQSDELPPLVVCSSLYQDPIIPDNIILDDVRDLECAVEGKRMRVRQCSIRKSEVIRWMVGSENEAPLSEMLVTGR